MVILPNGHCVFMEGYSKKPPSSTLEMLVLDQIIQPGAKNLILFTAQYHRIERKIKLFSNMHMWSSTDSIVVSDIDGTVTKSDIRGVLNTVLTEGYTYAHPGICKLYSDLVKCADYKSETTCCVTQTVKMSKLRFLYLTSRPLVLLDMTRKFLISLRQTSGIDDIHGTRSALPVGPVMCHPGSLPAVLTMELVTKSADKFKADVLRRQINIPFAAAGRNINEKKLYIAAFGNKMTDARAYESVGMNSEDVYIINKKSDILCMSHNNESERRTLWNVCSQPLKLSLTSSSVNNEKRLVNEEIHTKKKSSLIKTNRESSCCCDAEFLESGQDPAHVSQNEVGLFRSYNDPKLMHALHSKFLRSQKGRASEGVVS
mmetsp:Transcript_27972/g.32254  ORF Transcript_27972/g.32254 Transcript_27972/m.32254 type:complete len:372 (+) Transcript_27972:128-1243(+)